MERARVQVRDIMASPPVTTTADCTALDAARLMRDRNIGSLIVNDGSRPVGILTERDILAKVVAEGIDPKGVTAGELMSSPILTIAPDADVLDAAISMARHGVRRLPVLNGSGQLAGILCERDILAVSPEMVEVTRTSWDAADEEHVEEDDFISKCEACMCLSDGLRSTDGMLLCEDCWQEQRVKA